MTGTPPDSTPPRSTAAGVATAVARLLVAALELLGAKVDVILPNGQHLYRCTGHRHGITKHCASPTRVDGGPKLPAKCKWCPAPCQAAGRGANRNRGATP